MKPASEDADPLIIVPATISDEIERVYRREGVRMWRALYAYSGSREIADDAVAEAFAQALRRGAALTQPERWIWKAAYHIAAGALQTRGVSAAPFPELSTYDDHQTVELLEALSQLSHRQRACVVLHYWAGYSLTDIARIIGTAPPTVGVHLNRGRHRLRTILGEGGVS